MRSLSPTAVNAVNSPDGNGVVFLATLHIKASLGEHFFVNNNEDLTGTSGQVYTAYPFEILLPDDSKEGVQQVSVQLDNVAQELLTILRGEEEPIQVEMMVCYWDRSTGLMDDQAPEVIVSDLKLLGADWNNETVSASLSVDSLLNQQYPSNGESYDPLQFRGLH